MSYNELFELSNKFNKSIIPSAIQLPAVRFLSSLSKDKPRTSDPDGLLYWLQEKDIPIGKSGWHEQFEFCKNEENVIILRVDDIFINDSKYCDYTFKRCI